ncbi:hypothetical protein [Lysobacter koreensis]|uniref:hypothetical protein n=1 Tax=Lysobacter koreensis TaxID=266122 RepID=UPI0036DB417C
MRLHRIGERPAQAVLVTFDKDKSDSRAQRAKALDLVVAVAAVPLEQLQKLSPRGELLSLNGQRK